MSRLSGFTLSNQAKLVALATLAVLLPTTALSIMQYRSLVELEGQTKVAVQEKLRQTLEGVTRDVAENLTGVAKAAIGQLEPGDLSTEKLDETGRNFAAFQKNHPEIDQLFLIQNCSCDQKSMALINTSAGQRQIGKDRLYQDPETSVALTSYASARSAAATGPASDFFFWYQACPINLQKNPASFQVYLFHPLVDRNSGRQMGFAGVKLSSKYLEQKFFPQVIPELLRKTDSGQTPSQKDAGLVLAISDENRRPVFATSDNRNDYEVKATFAPAFPKWELGVGYAGTSIESLARRNFQRGLMLTGLVLGLLFLGLAFTLRAASRQAWLAEAKSTFVSNVSHELRTPLALIRLYAETLELGRLKSPEKACDYYRIIGSESRRLTHLVDNILDFAQVEAGHRQYRFFEVDVASVVEDVVKGYNHQLSSAGFEVQTDLRHNLPTARIDSDAISQAVLNLLNNAVKYSGDTKAIMVRVYQRGDQIVIEVADSGIGIPRREQGRIFEKFYRISDGLAHNTKGSGLGLALVKHIIEAHQGRVLVESAPGKGSKFTLLVPLGGGSIADTPKQFHGVGRYEAAENPDSRG